MLSISGAILRFSWFISNSYSKSEIARKPFTIALAPCLRANSTTSVSNVFTCTLGRSAISASMNPMRSSASNSVFCLRTGWFTTATITLSNTPEQRLITSRWPNVTGSYEPGQIAIPLPLLATVDGDARVAVDALVDKRERELQAIALVGFGHGQGRVREQRRQQLVEPCRRLGSGTIWRVGEHDAVRAVRSAEPGEHVAAVDRGLGAQGVEVGAHGRDRPRVAVHERRLGRAARQRLDPERARTGEQVEHARFADGVAEDREERLADAVGGRAGGAAGGRLKTTAAIRACHDPHAAIGSSTSTRSSACSGDSSSGSRSSSSSARRFAVSSSSASSGSARHGTAA